MCEKRNLSFLKGTISLSISVVITKILGVAFKIPLSYVLGDSGMGYFNTAYAIYGFFYILCTAGVPKSLTLVMSEYRDRCGNSDSDGYILVCGLRLFGIIGIISTLFNIICAPALATAVGNKGAILSILAIAPSILFVSLSGVLRGYLNSSERLGVIAISQFIEGALKLALGLAFAIFALRIGASVKMISALAISGITVGSAISCLYMLTVCFSSKIDKKAEQNIEIPRKDIKRKILKNALPIALSSALLNLASVLDLAIIIKQLVRSGMSEGYANSIYGNYTTLAVPMFNLVISVLAPVATSYMPRLSKLHLSGDRIGFTKTVNRLLLITLVISIPASLAFYFYSFDLLDLLFSLQSSALGAPMLIALSFGLCFLTSLTVVNTALESERKISATVLSLLLGSAVKLAVSYVLIGNSNIGILGAPIGTVVSYGVSLSVSLLILESSGVRLLALFKACGLYLLGLAAFYPPYRLLYSTTVTGLSLSSMILSILISGFIYLALLALVYGVFYALRCLNCTKNNN